MTQLSFPTINGRLLPFAGMLLLGLALGWLFFSGPSSGTDVASGDGHEHGADVATVWTCSMHPQIRQPDPGLCPICAMDLIPLEGDGASSSEASLRMSEEAVQAASVSVTRIERGLPFRVLRLAGTVQPDESRIAGITARYAGRIERLYVNVTGQQVRRGQKLAAVYSPELLAAQKELLEAGRMRDRHPDYYAAAKAKLRSWGLTEEQIAAIESGARVQETFDVLSPQSGTVLQRQATEGQYVREGDELFRIADLGRVWILFDAYEQDLAWLREGMTLSYVLSGSAGEAKQGRISFIDPVIDAATRVARVRVEVANPDGRLRPEMYATGTVKAALPGRGKELLIPKSAVLWTGTRSVVWVRDEESDTPLFHYREVLLGEETGDSYVLRDGVEEGELLVTDGVFAVDAAAQLQGKTSMMHAGGRKAAQERAAAEPAAIPVPGVFRQQLRRVFDAYENLTGALVASDAEAAAGAAADIRASINAVGVAGLSDGARARWAELLPGLRGSADAVSATRRLSAQRRAYEQLSTQLYAALRGFGVHGTTVYHQYCPMAFDDEGAYWLSSQEPIRNPYFGDAMLKCGVTKQVLTPISH